jgi:MFS family permease
MIVTGLFFHHLNLADVKGWSHLWIAGNYFIYAIFGSSMAFVLGPLIDRFGAVRFLPWKLTPLILALVVVAQFDSPYVLWPYFILLGVSAGTHVLVTAMWAEIYGVDHLGAIKSLVTALEVFASAIGPVLIGIMLVQGWGFSTALYIFAGYSVAATVLLMFALRRKA